MTYTVTHQTTHAHALPPVIKTDMTYTVTHQTTHALPPGGTQNAVDESHKKASTQQAARRTDVLARCRRAHGARLGRWRSQKHRWWPSAGVSGGDRSLTCGPSPQSVLRLVHPWGPSCVPGSGPSTHLGRRQEPKGEFALVPNPKKHDSQVGPSGWPATRTPGIATRRFPPAVILCELCVLICQQYT